MSQHKMHDVAVVNTIMTKSRAIKLLHEQIVRGSSYTPLANGRRPLATDTATLISRWCRRDAVGRISTVDAATIRAAIADLTAQGKLHGELNGYLLA